MARRVFFSFHYEADVWRAGQVRNSWITKPDREAAGFWDAADWESVKRGGDAAIRQWINRQLNGTTVTAVLIGAQTAHRPYVQYEIQRSWDVDNGLFGIYISGMRDSNQLAGMRGPDPFPMLGFTGIRTYDWVTDNGYANLGQWVEAAFNQPRNRG
jgi:hypothetical protein